MRTRRILFFAEAVTLAHVARPVALAQSLPADRYETRIACDPRYRRFVDDAQWLDMRSISSARFLGALASGTPAYDTNTLRNYVAQDLALIHSVKPDLIVGDFRLSLSVSARLSGVPYAAISNAYWSPYYARVGYPLPVLPITRFLPLPIADRLFRLARAVAFKAHCAPLNRVRREHGLLPLGSDLRAAYTDADHVLYADSPRMFPTIELPSNHRYLGPIVWSPPVALPDWWSRLPNDKPVIYLTLGSSGNVNLGRRVIQALADLPVSVIASTAGAPIPSGFPANAYFAPYLPGDTAAARSQLVICNGGSPTSHQALAAGVPVLGIAANMDQFLNMRAIVEMNAGFVLRADRLKVSSLRATVRHLLSAAQFRQNAEKLASAHHPLKALRRFVAFVASETAVDLAADEKNDEK